MTPHVEKDEKRGAINESATLVRGHGEEKKEKKRKAGSTTTIWSLPGREALLNAAKTTHIVAAMPELLVEIELRQRIE